MREDIRELYEKYYQHSPNEIEWMKVNADDKADNIEHFCAKVPHASIIDIGSGTGEVIRALAGRGFGSSFVAADVSESGLAILRADPFPGLADVVVFDGSRLPVPDGAFDLAVMSHVVEHLENPRLALAEAARVARHVYIEVPLEYRVTNRRMSKRFELDHVGHLNFYTPNLARLLVESSGYTVLACSPRHVRREVYTFHRPGINGLSRYWIKEACLRVAPRLACSVLGYHFGLVYRGGNGAAH